jgi:hypothetical protein
MSGFAPRLRGARLALNSLALAGLLAGCRSETATAGYRDGVDAGYVLGSADAVKRLYWSKQALENPPRPAVGLPPDP